MNDISRGVAACFRSVLPGVTTEQLPQASMETTSGWDSLVQVTLLSAMSEEFGVDFEADDFENLVSYSLIMEYLKAKLPESAGS